MPVSGRKRSNKEAGLAKKHAPSSKRTRATMSSEADNSWKSPLLRVGAGEFTPCDWDVSNWSRQSLLNALQKDASFCSIPEDVNSAQCCIYVGAYKGKEPSPSEESRTAIIKLAAAETVRDTWVAKKLTGKLFLQVDLPAAQPAHSSLELVECEANSDESKWLAAMLSYQSDPGADIITLDGAEWPTLLSPTLFKRTFYDSLVEGVLGGLSRDKTPKIPSLPAKRYWQFIILGSPGIGKSAFALYVVYLAVRRGLTVVYQSRKQPNAWVIKDKKIYAVQGEVNHRPELKQPSTVFISDGVAPPVVPALTLLISSTADRLHSKLQEEAGCAKLYLPTYSRAEMLRLRAACFPTQSASDVTKRYSQWGGNVRHVLTKTSEADQRQLEAAVSRLKSQDLCGLFGLHVRTRGEVEHKLKPSTLKFYEYDHTDFCSKHVEERVLKGLNRAQKEALLATLRKP